LDGQARVLKGVLATENPAVSTSRNIREAENRVGYEAKARIKKAYLWNYADRNRQKKPTQATLIDFHSRDDHHLEESQ
jgi:hypothetical protein